MKLKSSLRRTAVLTAGALIGLSGAFALAGPASAHHSSVSGSAVCDTKTGEWVVTWKTDAESGGKADKYRWTKVELTPQGSTLDNPKIAVTDDYVLTDGEELTGVQRVAGSATSASLTVAATWNNGKSDKEDRSKTVTFEGECKKDTPPPTTTPPTTTPPTEQPPIPGDLPGEPEPILDSTCDTITIGLDNPVDGLEITLTFKTSKGEKRTLVIKAGERKSTTFSATPGFTVDVTFTATLNGKPYSQTTTVGYEQPEDCDNGGNGGGLPVTGAAAGGIAGGAGALLAVGAGLFVLARRRRVTFTA